MGVREKPCPKAAVAASIGLTVNSTLLLRCPGVLPGISKDNLYGKCLYLVTDRFKEYSLFSESMIEVIKKEYGRNNHPYPQATY